MTVTWVPVTWVMIHDSGGHFARLLSDEMGKCKRWRKPSLVAVPATITTLMRMYISAFQDTEMRI